MVSAQLQQSFAALQSACDGAQQDVDAAGKHLTALKVS
jgi:hypothetical protein